MKRRGIVGKGIAARANRALAEHRRELEAVAQGTRQVARVVGELAGGLGDLAERVEGILRAPAGAAREWENVG